MYYSEAKRGRVFVPRLEHGEILHGTIERFAREQRIRTGALIALGGADAGSVLVIGSEQADAIPVTPTLHTLQGVHELVGTGTLAHILHPRPIASDGSIPGCTRSQTRQQGRKGTRLTNLKTCGIILGY